MKRKILVTIVLTGVLLSVNGCYFYKTTNNTSYTSIEGGGSVVINSNLMNSLQSLGENYEFTPLDYESGVVRGIISPEKIYHNDIFTTYPRVGLNPIKYTEYTMDALDINAQLKESGEVLAQGELSTYEINFDNPKDIILRDNKRKLDKQYSLKALEKASIKKDIRIDLKGTIFETLEIFDENKNKLFLSMSEAKTIGENGRYLFFRYYYQNDYEGNLDVYKITDIIYDSRTGEFYEEDSENLHKQYFYNDDVIEIGGELYFIKSDGKIYKVLLKDGKIILQEFYDFQLSENEYMQLSSGYTELTVKGDEIILDKILDENSRAIYKTDKLILNVRDKTFETMPMVNNESIFINKIFSNGENLFVTDDHETKTTWVISYKDGNFKKEVKIDDINDTSTFSGIPDRNITDILYDEKTNTFFIKRKAKGKVIKGDNQSYQYEVLKLE